MWPYLRPYRRHVIGIVVSAIISRAAQVSLPRIIAADDLLFFAALLGLIAAVVVAAMLVSSPLSDRRRIVGVVMSTVGTLGSAVAAG